VKSIETQVNKFFIAVDSCDWDTVERIFAETVEADYSSMNGQPAAKVKAKDLIEGWKGLLPGFDHTHHQLGNMVVLKEEKTASVFCYGTATHYLENDKGNIWTVVGSYDIDLEAFDNNWRITKLKLNFKYQDGNLELPNLAMEALK
jgi:hypothetical protein